MPITTTSQGSALTITLDRPERRNAMDAVMAEQLEQALDQLENDPELRVGILTGAAGHFSAGTDLSLPRSPATQRGGEYGIVRRLRAKPLIAAVEGVAFGGGLEIVLACELIVVASGARLALPEAQRGLVPTCGGIFRILEALPESVAMGVLLAGEEIDGATAGRLGLATRVGANGHAVSLALELAESVCRRRHPFRLSWVRSHRFAPQVPQRVGVPPPTRSPRSTVAQTCKRGSLRSSSGEFPPGTLMQ
ncbi:enoyl-CoA hydratase-related protein [Micrococcaceae bacterium Sec5.1]